MRWPARSSPVVDAHRDECGTDPGASRRTTRPDRRCHGGSASGVRAILSPPTDRTEPPSGEDNDDQGPAPMTTFVNATLKRSPD